jgi:hypothetical protein
MFGEPVPGGFFLQRSAPLPRDLRQFESAAAVADSLSQFDRLAARRAEVQARLDAAAARLEVIKAVAAKRRNQ